MSDVARTAGGDGAALPSPEGVLAAVVRLLDLGAEISGLPPFPALLHEFMLVTASSFGLWVRALGLDSTRPGDAMLTLVAARPGVGVGLTAAARQQVLGRILGLCREDGGQALVLRPGAGALAGLPSAAVWPEHLLVLPLGTGAGCHGFIVLGRGDAAHAPGLEVRLAPMLRVCVQQLEASRRLEQQRLRHLVEGVGETYRALFEALPCPVLLVDPGSGVPVLVNPRLRSLLGWDGDACPSIPVWELEVDADAALARERITRLLAGETLRFASKLQRPDGGQVSVMVRARAIDVAGQALLLGLLDGEDLPPPDTEVDAGVFRRGVDALDIALLFLDVRGRVLHASAGAGDMLGYPPGALSGMPVADLDRQLWADWDEVWTVLEQGQSVGRQSRLRDGDGRRLAMDLRLHPVAAGGGRLLAALHAVATPSGPEQPYRMADSLEAILNAIDGFVYVADMQTHELLWVNEYTRHRLGAENGHLCWQVLQRGQDGPCAFCTNDRLLDARGQPAGVHVWEFRNTRTGQWIECHDRAIPWWDGRLVRMEIALDITDHKTCREELTLLRGQPVAAAPSLAPARLQRWRQSLEGLGMLLDQLERPESAGLTAEGRALVASLLADMVAVPAEGR